MSRSPTPHSLGGRRSERSHDSRDATQESPQALLSPDSSKQESLRTGTPSRRVLFSYQDVFFICRKSAIASLSSLIRKKTSPASNDEPEAKTNTQPKSIMSLKLDRLKDKCHGVSLLRISWRFHVTLRQPWRLGLKTRTSPSLFRFAGYIFLIIILVVLGSVVVVGWYGLSEDTISHQTVTTKPTTTALAGPDHDKSFRPTQTASYGQSYIQAREGPLQAPPVTTIHPSTTENTPAASLGELKDIIVQTLTLNVTPGATAATAILSLCTTCTTTSTTSADTSTIDSQMSTSGSTMTGIMYCSFTGRRNIYTLCPYVHVNSPAMLTDTPGMVTSGAPRTKNSLSAVRLAILSLWNSMPSLGSVMQPRDPGAYDCNCTGMKKKLDSAIGLIRTQQQLLEGQRSMINEHRKSLHLALETLANITAARVGEKIPGGTPLDLKI
ncbi:hypothetical protein ANO14919_042700 [Xylariales sp. No.14919]|nr:hypothetical protein ANO14919_042700 [Xylariales sp. No.14919]